MSPSTSHKSATARYAVVWLLATAAVAVVIALAVNTDEDLPEQDPVELETAARDGGCVLRRETGATDASTVGVMQPPTFGPPAEMAAPGVYTTPPPPENLVGALRRGIVVVQYRPHLPRNELAALRRTFRPLLEDTIVTPDGTGMRYAVAVTAWSRLLGCPRVDADTLELGVAFQREYAGSGPDSGFP